MKPRIKCLAAAVMLVAMMAPVTLTTAMTSESRLLAFPHELAPAKLGWDGLARQGAGLDLNQGNLHQSAQHCGQAGAQADMVSARFASGCPRQW